MNPKIREALVATGQSLLMILSVVFGLALVAVLTSAIGPIAIPIAIALFLLWRIAYRKREN